jgi:hypothetical protein
MTKRNNTGDTKSLCQQKALLRSLLSKEVAVADLRVQKLGSLTKKEHRLKVFENGVLRRIFGPRRDK